MTMIRILGPVFIVVSLLVGCVESDEDTTETKPQLDSKYLPPAIPTIEP